MINQQDGELLGTALKKANQPIRIKNERIEKLEAALRKIGNIMEDTGREGCTYGDTEYDSLSAAYGYNQCRDYCLNIAANALINNYGNSQASIKASNQGA